MSRSKVVARFVLIALITHCAGGVFAQTYPNKPIRLVTSAAGGGADFVARLAAQGLTRFLGQQVVVDNRGSGIFLGEIVARAPADGYTVLVAGPTFWLAPFFYERLNWDPTRDFSPVTLAITSPNVLVIHPSVAANSVKDLISLAKARPGELNYGTGGSGSTPHLAAELFMSMAGVTLTRINYKGSGPAFNDLIAGQVQLMFGVGSAVMPHVKSARLRALAITSAQPSDLFPGMATLSASGLPGYESVNIVGIFVPARTSPTIISHLNQAAVRAFNSPDVKDRVFNSGSEVVASTPERFGAVVKSEMTRLGKVIRDAGIRPE